MATTEPSSTALDRVHGLLGSSDFLRLLNCQFDEVTGTRVAGWLEVGPQHHQPFGLLHGGVLCSVVETFASVGAWEAVRDGGRQVVGVANSTDFLRSTVSGRLDVVGTAVYQGRTLQLWDVVITRAVDGKDVARGRVRLQVIDPR